MDPIVLTVIGVIVVILALFALSGIRVVQQYERGVIFINQQLQAIIDEHTENWGIKMTAVEIKDIELPVTMQRAMAKQAEAEREKRAKIIHAEGEFQASTQLAQAANIIGSQPSTLQLRYLQTLTEIAVEKNSTIIFPLPIDIIEPFIGLMKRSASSVEQQNGDASRPAPYVPPTTLT